MEKDDLFHDRSLVDIFKYFFYASVKAKYLKHEVDC